MDTVFSKPKLAYALYDLRRTAVMNYAAIIDNCHIFKLVIKKLQLTFAVLNTIWNTRPFHFFQTTLLSNLFPASYPE